LSVLPDTHPTATVYVDESGWTSRERFLAVGALKVRDHVALERRLRAYRRESEYDGRLRWASLGSAGARELAVARRALRFVCTNIGCDFACAVVDRHTTDIPAVYGSEWEAYNRLAARAIGDALDDVEIATVIADRFDAPATHDVEAPVRRTSNDRTRRLAVVGVHQAPSACFDGIQVTDLLLGAVVYQLRQTHVPTGSGGARMRLSLEVMQQHYGVRQFLSAGPGTLEMNHLKITLLPVPRRGRGNRGGRRRRP
jgi:hypothetical protein